MSRFLILAAMLWLIMLLPAAILLQRVAQAQHDGLLWGSLALAPLLAGAAWQALSIPLPTIRFAVLQWLGIGYSLGFSLVLTAPLLLLPITPTELSCVTLISWLLLYIYGLYCALVPQIKHIKLQSPKLTRRWKIVQISDVHVGSRRANFLHRVVAQVRQQQPDLVLITGDLVDGSDVSCDDLKALAGLTSPSYMISGNHERYIDMERVLRDVESQGTKVLRNAVIEHQELRLIGLDDEESEDQVALQLERLNPTADKFNILLNHKPDGWPQAIQQNISLMLSGHTHGGQIWPFVYAVKRRHPQYRGLYSDDGHHLYVNQGTGTWGPTYRLGTRGEITVFELCPSNSDADG